MSEHNQAPQPGDKWAKPGYPDDFLVVSAVGSKAVTYTLFQDDRMVNRDSCRLEHWPQVLKVYDKPIKTVEPPTRGSASRKMHAAQTYFHAGFDWMCAQAHENSQAKGFWEGGLEDDINKQLAATSLMMEELGELNSALRVDDKPAGFLVKRGIELQSMPEDHRPALTNRAEELADLVIRAMDFSKRIGVNLGDAIAYKMNYNKSRAFRHGKKA